MSGRAGFGGRLARLDPPSRVGALVGAVLLVAVGTFLLAPELVGYPLVAAVLVVGYGLFADQATTVRALTLAATVVTVLVLALITVYLVAQSIPAFRTMGPGIVLKRAPFWNPDSGLFSLVPMIWGTVVTTLIATLVAAPLGVAGAVFIAEMAPDWARGLLKPAVEGLAGVPSIVYGFIGLTLLSPFMSTNFGLPTLGSLLVVGAVIGAMALPTVVSVAEDAIDSVPSAMKDGSLALGATDWQTTTDVTLPAAFSGVSAAVLLGVGRAVGETMAATVILANVTTLPDPLYDVFGNTITLTSLIASQYGIASGTQMSALFAAGVILFVTVLGLSLGSQYVERRMERSFGGNR
ncbi:phosphate ABC transporter permease subunit PstC [Halococcus hamelinensis]|uniref:Phosphate transport system permease protein n=2 Tax=Halococcus hamelinensis TaxID=332168 RepID=M0LW20_9EURY|nr:phosphate ABC transporter permease subunit PstC [Halococcus hamelinensis]EMA37661.1 phosphate ABC transporter membrane protein 1, phot family [Halococcus hamelinensis 100A6]